MSPFCRPESLLVAVSYTHLDVYKRQERERERSDRTPRKLLRYAFKERRNVDDTEDAAINYYPEDTTYLLVSNEQITIMIINMMMITTTRRLFCSTSRLLRKNLFSYM